MNDILLKILVLRPNVTLVAVTKSVGIEETNEVIKAGVRAIGENRIEDAEKKFPHLLPVEKHFIGQIQSRKIKRIVELFDVIQSVGSIEHLQRIENEADKQQKDIRVLLQFNISGEKQRGGFNPEELGKIIQAIASDPLSANSRELADKGKIILAIRHVEIIGVMGMASQTNDMAIVRKQFRLLKSIRDELRTTYPAITELSMGMSDEYKIAIE
ncbi:MAG: hypothetical protein A3D92_22170, partial [Bacteroidetes bacterium RIFCSPHIGHO2_02_FULL_44_7]